MDPRHTDSPPGRGATALLARVRAPATLGAVGVAALALVALRDPHVPGSWGACPFLALTGLYCPGCGGLRAVHDLVHLRLPDALHTNAFGLLLAGGLAACWLVWLLARVRDRPVRLSWLLAPATTGSLLIALVVFSVLRNTPWGTWLAPA